MRWILFVPISLDFRFKGSCPLFHGGQHFGSLAFLSVYPVLEKMKVI